MGLIEFIRTAASRVARGITSGQNGVDQVAADKLVFCETGFHSDRYLLDLVDQISSRCEYFIETGTNVGSTLAYMARLYPKMQCLSCEPDTEAYKQSIVNTEGQNNIVLYNETSQDFIIRLKREYNHLFDKEVMFWLDAHGYGFKWPLMEELAFITAEFKSGYVFIDDFKVPGLDCFLYDVYQDQICSLDFVKGSLNPGKKYRVYYPAYTEKTSSHHPLCGWGLIEFGHADEPTLPDRLKEKLRGPDNV